ncbi:SDR family NAD(P)-dependent oxidoreductase [Flavisphingomonas formosensis]|uniref:SDR family NAD(P)-dependent oxidoreductase n=1 Tax=Flavisphingomonas formosensis TaxID=861534 RepID=UPI0012FB379A|nr:SDR family oxidoreductase [Sphingomonas formosensis]
MEHQGRTAFITGGARGLGFGFAKALAAEGARIAIADIDAAEGERAAARLRERGAEAIALACDVANEESVDEAIVAAEAGLGGVDILINNAGLLTRHYSRDFSALPRADIRACLDVNIMGVINCAVSARKSMARRGGGTIVNIASIAGYSVAGAYGLSKLAVRGLTISLAREFAPDGIRVNGVAPGLMATDTVMADLPREMVDHFVNDLQLIKRQGQPQDIVDAVLFLCSSRAGFITGETIKVAGGFPLEV